MKVERNIWFIGLWSALFSFPIYYYYYYYYLLTYLLFLAVLGMGPRASTFPLSYIPIPGFLLDVYFQAPKCYRVWEDIANMLRMGEQRDGENLALRWCQVSNLIKLSTCPLSGLLVLCDSKCLNDLKLVSLLYATKSSQHTRPGVIFLMLFSKADFDSILWARVLNFPCCSFLIPNHEQSKYSLNFLW